VGNRTNNLGDAISVTKTDGNTVTVTADSKVTFAKRYLKYLTKKFLKKQSLRDYVRVISTSKTTYQLRYFNIARDEEAEE
ncbi:60S ribosomal protein L22, partial [Gonapodya sp. JEL0774]